MTVATTKAAPPGTTERRNVVSATQARARLLQMHYEAKVGHIGGNLSALDAMLHLHGTVMGPEDLFVLSKGHSAGALYITLWAMGFALPLPNYAHLATVLEGKFSI